MKNALIILRIGSRVNPAFYASVENARRGAARFDRKKPWPIFRFASIIGLPCAAYPILFLAEAMQPESKTLDGTRQPWKPLSDIRALNWK